MGKLVTTTYIKYETISDTPSKKEGNKKRKYRKGGIRGIYYENDIL